MAKPFMRIGSGSELTALCDRLDVEIGESAEVRHPIPDVLGAIPGLEPPRSTRLTILSTVLKSEILGYIEDRPHCDENVIAALKQDYPDYPPIFEPRSIYMVAIPEEAKWRNGEGYITVTPDEPDQLISEDEQAAIMDAYQKEAGGSRPGYMRRLRRMHDMTLVFYSDQEDWVSTSGRAREIIQEAVPFVVEFGPNVTGLKTQQYPPRQ